MWEYIIPATLNYLGSESSRRANERALDIQREGLESSYNTRHMALNKAMEMTPAEQKYFDRLSKESTKGDPYLFEQQQLRTQPIHQQGQFARQRATGQAIQQGLENSIVANELRRQVDSDTLKQLAKESDKLALHNKQYKRKAQQREDSARMQRAGRLQQLALQQANLSADHQMQMAGLDAQSEIGQAQAMSNLYTAGTSIAGGYYDSRGTSFEDSFSQIEGTNLYYNKDTGQVIEMPKQ